IFLLREWISQNARPGIFEDEEGEDRAAPRPQQIAPGPVPAPAPAPAPPVQAPLLLPTRQGNNGDARRIPGDGRATGRSVRRHVTGNRRVDRHNVNQRNGKARAEDTLEDRDSEKPTPSRTRRRLHSSEESEDSEEDRQGRLTFPNFHEGIRKKEKIR